MQKCYLCNKMALYYLKEVVDGQVIIRHLCEEHKNAKLGLEFHQANVSECTSGYQQVIRKKSDGTLKRRLYKLKFFDSLDRLSDLSDALSDKSWQVRYSAVIEIGTMYYAPRNAIELLKTALEDENAIVRKLAKRSIHNLELGGKNL